MRKLIFILLLFPFLLQAQVTTVTYFAPAAGGFSAEYQAVYDEMSPKPAADTAAFQNTMVVDLVAGGYWSTQWDVFYVPANGRIANAYLNWIVPTGDDNLSIAAATVTFAGYKGFTGDGAGGSVTTNWNPSTEGVLYVQNDATVGVYVLLDKNESGAPIGIVATYTIHIKPRVSGSFQGRLNAGSAGAFATVSDGLGFHLITRRASNDLEGYKDGSSIATATTASTGIPNANLTILSKGSGEYSTNTVAIAMAGGSISDADADAINTIIEAYMDNIGEGVQATPPEPMTPVIPMPEPIDTQTLRPAA